MCLITLCNGTQRNSRAIKAKIFDQASLAIEKLPPENRLDGLILKSKKEEQEGNLKQALTFEKHAIEESQNQGKKLHVKS